MALTDVIAQIDAEIAKLQQAKVLLGGSTPAVVAPAAPAPAVKKSGRGRPKGSKNAVKVVETKVAAKTATPVKRQLSPEGRKAIADAMKRRWAERRKAAGK